MIARMHDFDELRQRTTINTAVTGVIANDKFVSISSLGRYRKIYDVRLYTTSGNRDRKLVRKLPRRWDKVVPKGEFYARRIPEIYVIWKKDEIELWPVPDAVYVMHFRYTIWPAVVGADGSTLTLENIDDLLINLACSYLALSVGHTARSNEFYRAFANSARDALTEDVEDYDTHLATYGSEVSGALSLGYNDPFQRYMP